jgi:hypothetical protein
MLPDCLILGELFMETDALIPHLRIAHETLWSELAIDSLDCSFDSWSQ